MLKKVKNNLNKLLDRHRGRRLIKGGQFAGLDWKAFARLQAKYPEHWAAKYFNTEQFLVRNAARIYTLRLDRGAKRRILDIGCGFGYFLYAAKALGHKVQGLDLEDPLLDEVTDLLGVPKVHYRIEAMTPLPPIPGGPFDLITAFETMFDRTPQRAWSVAEWDFFLHDLTRFAGPLCELYLKFNQKGTKWRYAVNDEVAAYFGELGGRFDKRAVQLEDFAGKLKARSSNDERISKKL